MNNVRETVERVAAKFLVGSGSLETGIKPGTTQNLAKGMFDLDREISPKALTSVFVPFSFGVDLRFGLREHSDVHELRLAFRRSRIRDMTASAGMG